MDSIEVGFARQQSGGTGGSAAVGGGGRRAALISLEWLRSLVTRILVWVILCEQALQPLLRLLAESATSPHAVHGRAAG